MSKTYDVAIIGGGPAGLAAAANFARQLHPAIVFDSGSYRNARSSHMHTVPTWDHKDPKDFRASARSDLKARYSTTDFVNTEITQVEKINDASFTVTDNTGKTWKVKKLVIASGSADIYPDIEGYEECWARRIYHCLYCHGYEDRDAPGAGVLAIEFLSNPGMALHVSRMAAQLSNQVTIYTNSQPELRESLIKTIGSAPFVVDDRRITSLKLVPDDAANTKDAEPYKAITLGFEDGSSKTESFLVHAPRTHVKGPWAEQLGLKLTPMGDLEVTQPFQQTSVRGVFAAGDCGTMFKVATGAVSSGGMAAGGAVAQLQAEKWGHQSMF